MKKRDDLFEFESPEKDEPAEEQDEAFFFEMTDEEPPKTESQEELLAPAVEPEKTKSGSRQWILLLLLLVMVLLGAGYFFMGDQLFGPESTPAPKLVENQTQKIKIPERKLVQQEQKAIEEVVMPSEKVAGAPAEEKPAPQEEAAAIVKAPAEKTAEPVAVEPIEAKQEQAGSEAAGTAPSVGKSAVSEKPTAVPDVVAAAKAEEQTEVVAAALKAPYILQVGAYVFESSVERALKVVKSLGYEPTVIEGDKTVAMTRLRVGTYPEKIAREKLVAIQKVVPSAFLLRTGEQMALYAGSYYSLNRARVEADLLFQQGIEIEEETVDVAIPIKTIRFGAFPDSNSAGDVAEKAKVAGLEILVVKQN